MSLVEIIFLVVWLGVVATVLLGAVLLFVKAYRAGKEMQAYAARRGWTLTRKGSMELVERFSESPFDRGHSQRVGTVLQGRHRGRAVVAFHYRYNTGRRGDSNTHSWTVVALGLGVRAPYLSVAPAGRLSRLINNLTNTDIEVGHEEFDRAFTVRSQDPEFARDVLHPHMTRLLLEHPDIAWRVEHDAILALKFGSFGVDLIDPRIEFLHSVVARIPDHVWARLGSGPPEPASPAD